MKKLFWDDYLGMTTGFGFFCGSIVVVLVAVASLFAGITYGGRAYGRPTCKHWGEQAGVKTKFVILNWADSGTCLALTPSGRWVINSNWQAFVGVTK